jgi:hypothetical protein
METQKIIEIPTSVVARILGCHVNTVLYRREVGVLKKARRFSNSPHAPWMFDRQEVYDLKESISQ